MRFVLWQLTGYRISERVLLLLMLLLGTLAFTLLPLLWEHSNCCDLTTNFALSSGDDIYLSCCETRVNSSISNNLCQLGVECNTNKNMNEYPYFPYTYSFPFLFSLYLPSRASCSQYSTPSKHPTTEIYSWARNRFISICSSSQVAGHDHEFSQS